MVLHKSEPILLFALSFSPLTCLTEQSGENEDRLYFGSGNDQNFTFPRLTDLCQLVGIDLSPTSSELPKDMGVVSSFV